VLAAFAEGERLGRGSKLRRQTRRRLVVLVILALLTVAVLATASEAAGISARLSEGRPAWLILAAAFELFPPSASSSPSRRSSASGLQSE
jgi:hypothetical protein